MQTKCCKKCHKVKSLSEFGRQAKYKDGVKNYCKDCIKIMNNERYLRVRESHLAKVRKWQDENREKVLKYKKDYRERKRQSSVNTDTDGKKDSREKEG